MIVDKAGLPTRKSQERCGLLILLVLGIYWFENYSPGEIRADVIYMFAGKPAMWIFLIIVILISRRITHNGKIRMKNSLIFWTTIFGFCSVFVMIAGGFIEGFGKSPYDHSFIGMAGNAVFVFSALIGRELTRSYVINSHKGRSHFGIMIWMAVLMTMTSLSINSINSLRTSEELVKYIGMEFLPTLATNGLASYLVFIGGPWLSVLYIGIQQCFYWFCPILPDFSWITKALVTTVCPIFSLIAIQFIYSNEVKEGGKGRREKETPYGWFAVTIVSITIIWFATGVFPVRPFVIATGSMEPLIYPGDIVLVQKKDIEKLRVGDVIQYKKDNIYIFHRLIGMVKEGQNIEFITKGDNNSIPDTDPVKSESIKGKVIFTVPKLGWPTLLLKSADKPEREKVEF